MSDFLDRLKQEQTELNDKIGKLVGFVNSDNFNNITTFQQEMLKKQLSYMKGYASCVNLRLDDLNKEKI